MATVTESFSMNTSKDADILKYLDRFNGTRGEKSKFIREAIRACISNKPIQTTINETTVDLKPVLDAIESLERKIVNLRPMPQRESQEQQEQPKQLEMSETFAKGLLSLGKE